MNRAIVLRLTVPRRRLSQLAFNRKDSTPEVPIEIPKRIPRGPTDILRALSSTVKIDYTASHYKFKDDPFFIPATNNTKRAFSMAKESGRRAAKYFLKKYSSCFSYDPAEPRIPALCPTEVFVEGKDYIEKDLVSFIDNLLVVEAQLVFKYMQEQGKEVSQETILSLLQLTSFFNCEEADTGCFPEERWFETVDPVRKKTWKSGDLAEQLFEMIKDKDAIAYGAIIQGLVKYHDYPKAFALYEEMCSKGLTPIRTTYNYLLDSVLLMRENEEGRWSLAKQLLNDMQDKGVRPNLLTFNNLLFLFARIGNVKNGKMYALRTLAEMRAQNVEPSLATYLGVLMTFCKTSGPTSNVLKEIVELINEKTLVVRDARDVNFFQKAMFVCHEHLVDKALAYKVNEILEKNLDLLGNGYNQSSYYQNFFKLLVSTESIDVYMDIYHKYVPSFYTPDLGVFIETLQAIDLNDAFCHLPQLWSDIIVSGYPEREQILTLVLSLTARFKSSGTSEDDELQRRLVVVAKDALYRMKNSKERLKERFTSPNHIRAEHMAKIIQTLLNGGATDEAWQTVKGLVEGQREIVGFPEIGPLRQFVQRSCEDQRPERALFCARYCSEIGHRDVVEWMKANADTYGLDGRIRRELSTLTSPPQADSAEL